MRAALRHRMQRKAETVLKLTSNEFQLLLKG